MRGGEGVETSCEGRGGCGNGIMDDDAVRSWFENLPSGDERAVALATCDGAFVKTVMALVRGEAKAVDCFDPTGSDAVCESVMMASIDNICCTFERVSSDELVVLGRSLVNDDAGADVTNSKGNTISSVGEDESTVLVSTAIRIEGQSDGNDFEESIVKDGGTPVEASDPESIFGTRGGLAPATMESEVDRKRCAEEIRDLEVSSAPASRDVSGDPSSKVESLRRRLTSLLRVAFVAPDAVQGSSDGDFEKGGEHVVANPAPLQASDSDDPDPDLLQSGHSSDSLIPVLTLDPFFLEGSKGGCALFDLADEIVKMEVSAVFQDDDSSELRQHGFLGNGESFRIRKQLPPWFETVLNKVPTAFPLSLLILAKMELNIREAFARSKSSLGNVADLDISPKEDCDSGNKADVESLGNSGDSRTAQTATEDSSIGTNGSRVQPSAVQSLGQAMIPQRKPLQRSVTSTTDDPNMLRHVSSAKEMSMEGGEDEGSSSDTNWATPPEEDEDFEEYAEGEAIIPATIRRLNPEVEEVVRRHSGIASPKISDLSLEDQGAAKSEPTSSVARFLQTWLQPQMGGSRMTLFEKALLVVFRCWRQTETKREDGRGSPKSTEQVAETDEYVFLCPIAHFRNVDMSNLLKLSTGVTPTATQWTTLKDSGHSVASLLCEDGSLDKDDQMALNTDSSGAEGKHPVTATVVSELNGEGECDDDGREPTPPATKAKKKNKKKKKKKRKSSASLPPPGPVQLPAEAPGSAAIPSGRTTHDADVRNEAYASVDARTVDGENTDNGDGKGPVNEAPQKQGCEKAYDDPNSRNQNHPSSAATIPNSMVTGGITLSRLEGVNGTCVVGGGRIEDAQVDGDEWETVEPKGRGGGKGRRTSVGVERGNGETPSVPSLASKSPRKPNTRTSQTRRRPSSNRKAIGDIGLLDSVDEENTRLPQLPSKVTSEGKPRVNLNPKIDSGLSSKSKSDAAILLGGVLTKPGINEERPKSLRDVVANSKIPPSLIQTLNRSIDTTAGGSVGQMSELTKTTATSGSSSIGSSEVKSKVAVTDQERASFVGTKKAPVGSPRPTLDQSTGQTQSETLSGASANVRSTAKSNEEKGGSTESSGAIAVARSSTIGRASNSNAIKCRGDDGSSDEQTHPERAENTQLHVSSGGTNPPLPTLLGPGNTNSTASSVASSLEAPHATRHRPHHQSQIAEDDVGRHLLAVCDRLSRDMDIFMQRRALALSVRRRERAALLAALQDIVTNIWGGRSHVEMYGSCATELDLPSSDLDVVICGIDRPHDNRGSFVMHSGGSGHGPKGKKGSIDSTLDGHVDYNTIHRTYLPDYSRPIDYHHPNANHYMPHPGQYAPSQNGSRVIRLAAELRKVASSWAVQVKEIPTATVPVIKVLADPSGLPGASPPMEWMMQTHPYSTASAALPEDQRATAAVHDRASNVARNLQFENSHRGSYDIRPPYLGGAQYWRGSDSMNGLIQVDISFEGPEHGGMGSTDYTASVVRCACSETGLPQERTPIVQVIMVLKELLAQRRLNEPFKGGLSSYAILLLVVAVVNEREVIREEVQRIEQQRRAVSLDINSCVRGGAPEQSPNTVVSEAASRAPSSLTPVAPDGQVNWQNQASSLNVANPATESVEDPAGSNALLGDSGRRHSASNKREPNLRSAGGQAPHQGRGETVKSWAAIARKRSTPPLVPSAVRPNSDVKGSGDVNRPKSLSSISVQPEKANAVGSVSQDGETSHSSASASGATVAAGLRTEAASSRVPVQKEVHSVKNSTVESSGKKTLGSNPPEPHKGQPGSRPKSQEAFGVESFLGKNTNQGSLLFPQGLNDVLEVLCSGEPTAGKLLMHFLLFFGQLFDAKSTAVDVQIADHVDYMPSQYLDGSSVHSRSLLSPFIPRKAGGMFDPVTGVYSVDPIVIYDPWEGAGPQLSNVARSCYEWGNIRNVLSLCYMTLSGAVERGTSVSADGRQNVDSNGQGINQKADAISAAEKIEGGEAVIAANQPTAQEGANESRLLDHLLSF